MEKNSDTEINILSFSFSFDPTSVCLLNFVVLVMPAYIHVIMYQLEKQQQRNETKLKKNTKKSANTKFFVPVFSQKYM